MKRSIKKTASVGISTWLPGPNVLAFFDRVEAYECLERGHFLKKILAGEEIFTPASYLQPMKAGSIRRFMAELMEAMNMDAKENMP